jgi:hypothetical protein
MAWGAALAGQTLQRLGSLPPSEPVSIPLDSSSIVRPRTRSEFWLRTVAPERLDLLREITTARSSGDVTAPRPEIRWRGSSERRFPALLGPTRGPPADVLVDRFSDVWRPGRLVRTERGAQRALARGACGEVRDHRIGRDSSAGWKASQECVNGFRSPSVRFLVGPWHRRRSRPALMLAVHDRLMFLGQIPMPVS